MGRCPECGSWNAFSESVEAGGDRRTVRAGPVPLTAVERKEGDRLDTGNQEINGVLGGGLMRGSSVLVGGEPGIGKSTLMLQLCASVCTAGRVLYVSGEESAAQIRMRADRLGVDQERIEILCQTDLDANFDVIRRVKPVLIIVDSVQTIRSAESGSAAGTVTQIKQATQRINDHVKAGDSCVLLIGHVTKEGFIAGPKVIEHIVDTVLYFDQADTEIRLIRASKNRFGSTDEIGIFRMTTEGLMPVRDPALLFLEHREGDLPAGVAVAPVYEGSRVLLVEIQSLVVPAKGGISRVYSERIDSRRVSRIAAVLEKHLGLPLSHLDIYINVAGGIRIDEVAVDLALAMALYSAKTDLRLPARCAVFGEVSLAGEIRPVPHTDRRLKTAREMGFTSIVGPQVKEAGDQATGSTRTGDRAIGALKGYRAVTDLRQAARVLSKELSKEGGDEGDSP